jgi:hypothetical protein
MRQNKGLSCPRIVAFLLALLLPFWQGSVAAQNLNLRQILDLVEGSSRAVTSFDVRVNCSMQYLLRSERAEENVSGKKVLKVKRRKLLPNETLGVIHQQYRQVFQGGKGRIEALDKEGRGDITVYDQEISKFFHSKTNSAVIGQLPEGIVADEGWDYLRTFRNIQAQYPILDCLTQRKNVIVKEGGVDSSLVVVETSPDPKGTTKIPYPLNGYRIAFDKERGFFPAVIERLSEIRGQNFTARKTKVVEWHKITGGVWVPVKVVTNQFDPDPDSETFGEPVNEATLVVDIGKSSWNKEIPETVFDFPLAAGTKVTDRIREVQFITGKADPGKNLEDLAANARNISYYPVTKPPPPEEPRSIWVPIAWGTVAVVSSLLLWLSVHLLRKRRSGYVK